ncbi:Major facilitator superfamily domain general substrate transporter [Penicillium citrinum]|uniref:Major facilitator superfamily domain general substrate transporter n=1 Tax=Penicillium citrinum TaxID=5077 RepID=A0A9W9PE43_PENCI|nr:Major facilitator superfamily domain general substrate transporter [Penicillium citrinum]KAJ5242673.1 Major facilitator superfamily domain general substrate transporter [Penicillium citrinum]
MNETEKELQQAEADVSHWGEEKPHASAETNRPTTSGTTGSSSGSSSSVEYDPYIHRLQSRNTEVDLERRRSTTSQALSRIETQRLQHQLTVGESVKSRPSKTPLPAFGAGKPYPPPLPNRDDYVVEFDGPDDPLYPQNWPLWTKVYIGAMLAFTSICSTFDSAIFSSSSQNVAKEFSVGLEVSVLSSSLYIVGYASGPLIWAPLSELKGRRPGIVFAMLGFGIFNTAVAVSKDLQTLMICRFFCGIFGSSPLAVVAAVFSDIFNNRTRGIAIACFSSTVFLGPLIAPFIGGFINMSYLGWRWTAWIPAFMGYAAFVMNLFFLKESYPPVVLVEKASELRRRTKNWGIHAKQEEIEVDFRELIVNNFSRPLKLLFYEPLIMAVTIYLSFIYGLLYCFLTAYTLVFQQEYGMNAGVGGLPLFGLVVGLFIAAAYVILSSPSYVKKLDKNNNMPVPEWRLPPVMVAGAMFAAGLFWFGWTGFNGTIHWIVPTLSGLFTGFGLLIIFIQLFNYLIDTYLMFAASAIAANTFCRSMVAAAFPLFSRQMFENMGIQWASTLLGCVAAVLVPIPIAFYFFGKKLRMKSKFAPFFEAPQETYEEEPEQEVEGNRAT